MKYSIVVPTYNHCDDLLKPCIEGVLNSTIMNNVEIIVVANGCVDNTKEYLDGLTGFNLKTVWFDEGIGYTRATNAGIKAADPTSEYVILLNNDAFLLNQKKNHWIDMLETPFKAGGDRVGVTGPMKGFNKETSRNFLIFFCVMIRNSVFKEVGLLDEIFSPGSGEDVDFCIRLENADYLVIETGKTDFDNGAVIGTGGFPIFHEGERTVHDINLVKGWAEIFARNMEILRARYGVQTEQPKNIFSDAIGDSLPDGWFSELDVSIYTELMSKVPHGGHVIELGVWKGRSLCSVAEIIKSRNLKVWAVDTFEGTDTTPEEKENLADQAKNIDIRGAFEQNLKRYGLTDYVTVIKGNTLDTHTMFKDKFFDLLFLDADHTYESVTKDIDNWFFKVKPHGVFSGHDIAWTSVEKAVIEHFGATFQFVVGGNVWWVNRPKIFDCFMFFNEFDLLDIRLNELDDIVDAFVLSESPKTFSGKSKPLFFQDNQPRYKKFIPKIHAIVYGNPDNGTDYDANWRREEGQRDVMKDFLLGDLESAHPNDIVISSDLDEIPRASAIREYALYHAYKGVMLLRQHYSYYYLNNFTTDVKWQEGRVFPFWEMEKYSLSELRRGSTHYDTIPPLENAGWHFSFIGDVAHIRTKIEAFAHTEFDKAEIKSDEHIKEVLENGLDLFPRGNTKFNAISVDDTFPKYVLDNKANFEKIGYFRTIANTQSQPVVANKSAQLGLIKLNLGCGDLTYPDCINIDLYDPHADIKMDIQHLEYPDNYADEIIAYHVLEHLSPYDASNTLNEWYRVLKPNGRLIMELPNTEAMCAEFAAANKNQRYRLLTCIYGLTQPDHPHLFGWYPEILADHLIPIGFADIQFPPIKLTHHWGTNFRVEAIKPSTDLYANKNIASEKESGETLAPHKVYDGFLFFNELDVLELRLNELNDVVDTFVLVESDKTFTGVKKPFYFEENKEKFAKFLPKIKHIKTTCPDILDEKYNNEMGYNSKGTAWAMEAYQRDQIFKGFNECNDNDIIMLSDVDEIPKPSAVIGFDPENGMSTMRQKLFYYYFNNLCETPWYGTRIAAWKEVKDVTATQFRGNTSIPLIMNAGWHFSFIGGVDQMIEKLKAFSHQEYNTPYFTDKERMQNKILEGSDVFDRDIVFTFVDVNDELPRHVVDNKGYYIERELICQK